MEVFFFFSDKSDFGRTLQDQNGIMAISYNDNAMVNMLTNLFGCQSSESNTKRPEVVEFYNKYYHAVDTFNAAILAFPYPHRTTPMKTLLWYYFHMVIENCRIIYEYYNRHNRNLKISKQDFIRKIETHFIFNKK
jgi:hypothetical protein